MQCPKTVRIGGRLFKLKATDKDAFMASENFGNVIEETDTILYWEDATPLHTREIIMHEIDHCINIIQGLTDKSTEEEFTSRGTSLRVQVWFDDNPKLMVYMAWLKNEKKW